MRVSGRMGLCILVAVVPPALGGGTAEAAPATVIPIDITSRLPELNAVPECLDATVGTQVGTETTSGQLILNDRGIHFHGTGTTDYIVTFADGRYVTGHSTANIAVNITDSVATDTVVIREPRTIFDANGEPAGRVMIHAVTHLTYADLNGNGSPDPDEIRSDVDRFFFTCH